MNRTFPISIFTGLTMVIFIYLSVNVAYLTLLSPKELMQSNAVAFVSYFIEKFELNKLLIHILFSHFLRHLLRN